jgi:predicted house-cleaning noncanonical NTP pyrophosphatase (MazG superfamily)
MTVKPTPLQKQKMFREWLRVEAKKPKRKPAIKTASLKRKIKEELERYQTDDGIKDYTIYLKWLEVQEGVKKYSQEELEEVYNRIWIPKGISDYRRLQPELIEIRTLTYEAVGQLTAIGLGQSTAVGIGGDPINGLKHIDIMRMFNDDPDTDAVIMIGEIGGPDEAEAARWCKANMKKPIVGFIAGVTAPPGKRMGHAGALISGGADTADAKLAVMEECGFKVTRNPSEMAALLKAML